MNVPSNSNLHRSVPTDKAGGKKFSKDFEEGSAQLQEFVKFFDKQNKIGPPLLDVLSNADIFYEMQYNEVKIVANVSSRIFAGVIQTSFRLLLVIDKISAHIIGCKKKLNHGGLIIWLDLF